MRREVLLQHFSSFFESRFVSTSCAHLCFRGALFSVFSILLDLVCTNIKALPFLKGVYILDKQLISRLVGEFVKRFSIYQAGYNTLKKEFY